ncbi:MAG: hypothetical protein KJ063_23940 [Anaerolineae bacterium]|nr:hypothetical protein [Anaerolineae bacterium]
MAKTKKKAPPTKLNPWHSSPTLLWTGGGFLTIFIILFSFTRYESYTSLYDAAYVGSEACGDCHTIVYREWQVSPHANMTRLASDDTVVGDFDDAQYILPEWAQQTEADKEPAAKMFTRNGNYYMALRHPNSGQYIPFEIEYVIGYQYRQEYLFREEGGVLRRLPLQWSVEQQAYFSYWNFQEGSMPSFEDFWAQMTSLNSAWNLFCARCHTTSLTIYDKNANHTYAVTDWVDDGIACEACHGPGSHHINYFKHNYINRIAAAINSRLRGQPVAYIATAPKMTAGQDLSVCARCHGADIYLGTTDVYRIYEPGYSREGRINDLSPYFKEAPLTPGRTTFTVEVYDDGRPKGIGMVFRSFVESESHIAAGVRCYDCHNPHQNKAATQPGLLAAGPESDNYCLACHTTISQNITGHTFHEANTPGSFCYDCHMPRNITNLATGVRHLTRTHTLGSIPSPHNSQLYGLEGSPNACQDCHADQPVAWSIEWYDRWWGDKD